MKSLLKELIESNAIASNESEVKKVILNSVPKDVFETIEDNLGSIAFKKGSNKGKKIMFIAHMDEVGFMIKHITPEGMLVVIPIGNVRINAMNYQAVVITNRFGAKYKGTLVNNENNLYIDIGLDSDDQVKNLDINIGDMVTYDTQFSELNNNRYMGKALDDRCGCYTLLESMNSNIEYDTNEIYYVFSSSEEVGMRGAKTITSIIKPDYAFVIDVACAKDEFVRDYTNNRQLGSGPMILNYDKTMIPDYNFLNTVKDIASNNNIKVQNDMFVNGGTDGGSVHLVGGGVKTMVISIPNRYGHGPISIGDYQDLSNTIKLINAIRRYEW